EVDEPDRPVRRRAAVHDSAPVGEERVDAVVLALLGDRRVLLARGLEAADPLVHVPAEGADPADVVVVVHLAVGDDVEPSLFLVADDGVRRVVEGLLVLDLLEGDPDVAAAELVPEPARPRVRAHHRGRQNGVDDRLRHLAPPVARSYCSVADPTPLTPPAPRPPWPTAGRRSGSPSGGRRRARPGSGLRSSSPRTPSAGGRAAGRCRSG